MKRVFLAGAVLLLASRALCAELLVPGQYPTIQAAIDAALPGDTVIIAPGIYTGEGNYNISLGKEITVRSSDPNDPCIVDNTVIDCNGLGRGFYLDANSIVDGLTITNGSREGISVGLHESPVIRNCVIENCTAEMGGGISSMGSPTIIGCRITDNNATYGGGIFSSGLAAMITLIDCNISNNTAVRHGGGIYAGTLIIDNCRIVNNRSALGGGIRCANSSGTPTINRSMIAGNIASTAGGGIYSYSGGLVIDSSVVVGNFSQSYAGGGLYTGFGGDTTANRCTFAGNSAGGEGGGIYDPSGNLSLLTTNNIFWGNSDSSGTGAIAQIYDNARLWLSCIQDDDANDANVPSGGEEKGNIDDDPMFVRMPSDGGDGWGVGDNDDYGDLRLQVNSPCIDAGSPLYKGLDATDVDGRPRVIGQAIDMGAYEYDKIILVSRPAEGEVWATGSKRKIEWTQYGIGDMDILLSADGGENWQTIAEGVADANDYLWQVPDYIESNQCVISVVPADGDANVICHNSGLFTVSWYPVQPAVPPEWQHRGWLPSPDLSENKGPELGCIKWVFDTDGPVSSQVAVTRPYWGSYGVYIGCEDGNIYALDDAGEFIWSCDINTPIVGSPATGYYWMVYAAGQDGRLYAIDDYGDVRWTQTTNAPVYATPVVGYSGKIYVCSLDGLIYAFDADGSDLWTFETKGAGKLKGSILATPVIEADGAVYVAGLYDPNLYALDANNGSIKWVCNFVSADDPNNTKGRRIVASPAVGPAGTIYQTLINDPNLYAIDPCTGAVLWATNMKIGPDCGSLACCDAIFAYYVYVTLHPDDPVPAYIINRIELRCDDWYGIPPLIWFKYALSGGEGTPRAGPPPEIRVDLYDPESSWSSPAVAPDGTIYACLDGQFLRAVEPNGTIKWSTRLGMAGGFTLSVDRDGFIYAASDDGYVCVIDPNGTEVSRFKGNGWLTFPAITEDGTLIISDSNNRVWAITSAPCEGQPPALHRPADIQPSWVVDFMDFAVFANNWLDCTNPDDASCGGTISSYGLYAPGDINRNLYVNYQDIAEIANEWLIGAD